MSEKARKPHASKHGHRSADQLDPALRRSLESGAEKGELSCAKAFQLAGDLQKPASEIGAAADLLGIRLVKCQLGLFGYAPEKKIVTAAVAVDPGLEEAIRRRLENGRLPCRVAWGLAESFQMPRMSVSAACEALGIKVKPCQLGAF
jgi:hypothetical protein